MFNRQTLLKLTNLLLYLVSTAIIGTGLLLKYRLPPGSRGGRGLRALGLDRHDWGDLHFWLGLAAILLAILHVKLNWQWMRSVAAGKKPWRLVVGLGLGLAVILFFALLPVV